MKNKFTLFMNFSISVLMLAQGKFNGIESTLGDIFRLSDAKSGLISPENVTGEKEKGS